MLAPLAAWFDAGSSLVETSRLGCLLVAVTSGFLAWRASLELHPDKDISRPVFFFFWSAMLIAFAPAATNMFRRFAAERRHVLMAFICVISILPAHSYTRPSALSPFSEGLVQMNILQAYSQKGTISLIFPCHPILARNATGFDHGWLWEFLKLPILHEDLRKPIGSFTEQLMARQPILIAPQRRTCSPYAETERNALSDHLLNTGFIGKAEHDHLQTFLDRRYRLVNIMNGWFWLRNDIPESNY